MKDRGVQAFRGSGLLVLGLWVKGVSCSSGFRTWCMSFSIEIPSRSMGG